MIAYKNIFPHDFANLQYEKGFVHSIINSKDNLFEHEFDRIDDEIIELNKELERLRSSNVRSISILRAAYLDTNGIMVNGETESDYSDRVKFVEDVFKGKELRIRIDRYNIQSISLNDVTKTMESNPDYQQEKKVLEDIKEGNEAKIIDKLEKYNEEKRQVESKNLSELLNSNLIDPEINKYRDISNSEYNQLLNFLLIEGYIDENYQDYMNHFYPNDLRNNDKIFLRNLPFTIFTDPKLELKNLSSVVEILDVKDYSKLNILNYSLLEYLIKKEKLSETKNALATAKRNEKEDFVLQLYKLISSRTHSESEENVVFLINVLCSVWHEFYSTVIQDNPLGSTEYNDLLISFVFDGLTHLTSKDIEHQNRDSTLAEFINTNSQLLELLSEDIWITYGEIIVYNLETLEIKLNEIDHEKMYDRLSESIIENNLYELNYKNIEEIALFEEILPNKSKSSIWKFKQENLTRLMNSENDVLKARIKNNLNTYLNLYLSFSNHDTRDIEEIVLWVLNSNNVANKTKAEYIESMKYPVKDLKEIDNKDIWKILIKNGKVIPSIQNIVRYFQNDNNNWNEELIDFVNQVQRKIKVNYGDVIEEFNEIGFFKATLALDELSDDRYEDIIARSNYELTNDQFTIENLQNSKVELLLKHGMIAMNSTNLKNMRKNYQENLIDFIQSDIEGYLDLVTDQVNESEIIDLLNSNLSLENMDRILSTIGDSKKISLSEIKKDHPLMQTLIEIHLKETDKKLLFSDFNKFTQSVKKSIVKVAIENISIILDEKIDIDMELLKALLLSDMKISLKKDLVINSVDKLNFDDFLSLDSQLGLSEKFKKINLNKEPSYSDNPFNRSILEKLERSNIIKMKHINGKIRVSKITSSL